MELPLNSKFCNEGGAPVTQVSRSAAEYKQVTVLFADVVIPVVRGVAAVPLPLPKEELP